MQKHIVRNLAKHGLPILSSALCFLELHFTADQLADWRKHTICDWHRRNNIPFDSPLFLDSGGYQYLYNTRINLEHCGIYERTGQADLFALQSDWGASIITSLDYPIPSNLDRQETEIRMELNLQNACYAADLVADHPDPPFLYVYCHGRDEADIERCVHNIFERIGDVLPSFGLALNSMGFARNTDLVHLMKCISAARRAIPDASLSVTPIHVFGARYDWAPLLVYMGVDSLEDERYFYLSKRFTYIRPDNYQRTYFKDLTDWICDCAFCSEITLDELQSTHSSKKARGRTETGLYRIETYALMSLHNFEMMQRRLACQANAIASGESLEYLVENVQSVRGVSASLEWLATVDKRYAKRSGRSVMATPSDTQLSLFNEPEPKQRAISLSCSPDSFTLPSDYQPPANKRVLLVLPCSYEKPYSNSQVYSTIDNQLAVELGDGAELVHVVTLSGLYGPVPREFESVPEVLSYDFVLKKNNKQQIALITDRFMDYLDKHIDCYTDCFGFAMYNTYRDAFYIATDRYPSFQVMPEKVNVAGRPRFAYNVYADELVEKVKIVIDN